jgi:hypothetical protein
MSNSIYGYGESTGPYYPSATEEFYADQRKYSTGGLMNYASMNNARVQAAAEAASRRMFGGSSELQNERLFNSKAGATVRLGAQAFEGMYGQGSYVDMMAGMMSISSSGGLGIGSFGKTPSRMFAAGPVSDTVSQRLFDSANRYFSNKDGTDNVMRTQGADMSSVSRTMQILSNSGRYAGMHTANIETADLKTRLASAARNLAATGDTTSQKRIDQIINNSGGDEAKLTEAANQLSQSSSSNGQLRSELQTAMKSNSVINMNERAVEKIFTDTTDMLKVINKIKSAFGDMSESEAFRTAGLFSSGRVRSEQSINQMNASYNNMSATAASHGMTTGQFGQRAMANHAVLTQIFGSAEAAGVANVDFTNRLITNQRLNKGGVRTDQEVAESLAEDTAGVNQEANMTELQRLTYAASRNPKDTKAQAAATAAIEAVTGTLDPEKQAAALAKLRTELGDPVVNLSKEDQLAALSETDLGRTLAEATGQYVDRTKARSYDKPIMNQGLSKPQADQFRTLLFGEEGSDGGALGSPGMELLGQGKIDEVKKLITEAGLDPADFSDILSEDGQTRTRNIMSDAGNIKGVDMNVASKKAIAEQAEAKRIAVKDQYKYGSDPANPNAGKGLLRLGLDAILGDGKGTPSERDVMQYALTETDGNRGLKFTVDEKQDKIVFGEGEREAFLERASQGNPQIRKELEEALDKDPEKNLVAVGQALERYGNTIGMDGTKGLVLGKDAKEDLAKELQGNAIKEVYNKYGIETSLGTEGLSKEAIAAEKKRVFTEVAEKNSRMMQYGDSDLFSKADRGVANMVYNSLQEKGVDGKDPEAIRAQAVMATEALNSGAADKGKVLKAIGYNVATQDEFKGWREDLGIEFSEEKRKKWTEDGTASTLAEIMLASKTGKALSQEQQDFIKNLQTGGAGVGAGGGQTIANMTVTSMTVLKQEPQ